MKAIADALALSRRIDESKLITTVCHARPDGDAAGSSVALAAWLGECRGKDAAVILPGPVPPSLDFLLEGAGVIRSASDMSAALDRISRSDLLFCLDFNTMSRTEDLEPALRGSGAFKVLVDHHEDPAIQEFDLCFSSTGVSSACELLYEVLLCMPDVAADAGALPPVSARALMAGMTTDTNNFANSVFPGTLQMASALLAAGVDRDALLDRLYHSDRPNRLAAQGEMLSSLMKLPGDGSAVTVLPRSFYERHALLDGETEGFVNLPLSLEEVRLSVLARADKDCYRVSVRSKKGTSARMLAKEYFHGGGHEQASGGRVLIPGDVASPEDVATYVQAVTARFMQDTKR